MRASVQGLRVLQILGGTDADDDGNAALDLHRELTRLDAEVRTLALAPGRAAGLAATVPTMSPSAGSVAAHTQLRREQRWADVVVLRGERPAIAAGLTRRRGGPPVVLHLADEPDRWSRSPIPSRVLRLAGGAAALVVTCSDDAGVASRLGLGAEMVHVLPYGVEPLGARSQAERSAARSALGLPADSFVAHVVAGPDVAEVQAFAARVGVATTVVAPVDDRVVHFGEPDPFDAAELALAAADVVVAAGGPTCGPPWSLLRAAGAGLAVVAPARGALAELVDDRTGWTGLAAAASAEPVEVRRRGAAAAERVAERFAASGVAGGWADLLAALAAR